MDRTTNIAIRAILKGLRDCGAISREQLAHVADALHQAEACARAHHACDAYDLMRLASDIDRDAQALPAERDHAHAPPHLTQ